MKPLGVLRRFTVISITPTAFMKANSRTLREYTRELAEVGGFALNWTKSGVGAKERNELYVARDLAVYEREFPGLTEEGRCTQKTGGNTKPILRFSRCATPLAIEHLRRLSAKGLNG